MFLRSSVPVMLRTFSVAWKEETVMKNEGLGGSRAVVVVRAAVGTDPVQFGLTLRCARLLAALQLLWLRCFPARSRRSKRLTFSNTERLRVGARPHSAALPLSWKRTGMSLSEPEHCWTSARASSKRVRGCSLSGWSSCSHCWCCGAAESPRRRRG